MPQGMDLLATFFDQDAHLRVGGFEVDGEIVMAETFAGGGADGGDDHLAAGLFELRSGAFLSEYLHDMIDLRGIGDQHDLHVSRDDLAEHLFQRACVFRERPTINGHGKDLCATLF